MPSWTVFKCYLSNSAGTAVARDYVEFPSQILERWLETPEVLNKFALHYKTNEPIPMALVERIDEASTFNEGFSTVETIAKLIDRYETAFSR
jgi:peptidyl-dipeptidase Dcp